MQLKPVEELKSQVTLLFDLFSSIKHNPDKPGQCLTSGSGSPEYEPMSIPAQMKESDPEIKVNYTFNVRFEVSQIFVDHSNFSLPN